MIENLNIVSVYKPASLILLEEYGIQPTIQGAKVSDYDDDVLNNSSIDELQLLNVNNTLQEDISDLDEVDYSNIQSMPENNSIFKSNTDSFLDSLKLPSKELKTQKLSSNDIINYFMQKGLTENLSRGICGNLIVESGGIANILQGGKKGAMKIDGKTGFGLALWTSKDRQEALYKFTGTLTPSKKLQLDFIWHEFNTTYKNMLNKLKRTISVAEAVAVVMRDYEKPGIKRFNERLKEALLA